SEHAGYENTLEVLIKYQQGYSSDVVPEWAGAYQLVSDRRVFRPYSESCFFRVLLILIVLYNRKKRKLKPFSPARLLNQFNDVFVAGSLLLEIRKMCRSFRLGLCKRGSEEYLSEKRKSPKITLYLCGYCAIKRFRKDL